MNSVAQNISVTLPLGEAFQRVKNVLFKPFDLGKWFVIGFCAWLAYLGDQGFHVGYHFGPGGRHSHSVRSELEQIRGYIEDNIAWLAPLAITVLLLIIMIGLVILWLNSRGRFMFLHCVAVNRGEVRLPWSKYAREANSLFLFRLVLSIAGLVTVLPLLGGIAFLIIRMAMRETATFGGVAGAIGLFAAVVVLSTVFWVIGRLLTDFIVPIQFLRESTCLAAWREFRRLVPGNLGSFVLYLLFRIVIALAISALVLGVMVVTCCLACCLLMLPYIGTVVLLPVLVFERSYSLCFLRQFGAEYDVFTVQGPTAF